MKKLKKYEEFILLNESQSSDKRISEKDFWKLYNENCKVHTYLVQNDKSKNESSQEIYRGIKSSEEFFYTDKGNGPNRRSAEGANWFNLLLSNLESWSKYPKRSKSLICTTSKDYAVKFGNIYIVIPFDNVTFGVCPKNDIWFSFKNWLGDKDLYSFNFILDTFFEKVLGKNYKDDSSYKNLLYNFKIIEKTDKTLIQKVLSENKYIESGLKTIFSPNFIEDIMNKKITFLEFIENKILPEKNGFKLIKYDNSFSKEKIQAGTTKKDSKEIWTSSPCLLVSEFVYFTNVYNKIKQINLNQK